MSNMKQREFSGVYEVKLEDKISNLPWHVMDTILSNLPLREAVRTSILSSKWRYKWITLPNLVFDNQSILVSSQDHSVIRNKLINIIDHTLLLHTGPIHKFKLSHRDIQGVSDIDRWILYLSRSPIKEFILEIWKGHRYKLPSSIFLCEKLTHLELFNCLLNPPNTFYGFRSLKSLDLQHITMEQSAFEYMIINCPVLERLTLMNFEGFSHMNIHAPNLLFFDVGGVFDDVSFKDTIHLAIVSIGLYVNVGYDEGLSNLIKFFSNIPGIQRLEVQSFFLKYLSAGKIPSRLPNLCVELNYVSLRINFNDMEENEAALCILRSSPNLQELELLARPEEQQMGQGSVESINVEDYEKCVLNKLKVVKIVGICGYKNELNFIDFLLRNSPCLEKMSVKAGVSDRGWEMQKDLLKELLCLRRASVNARIVYQDP